MKSFIMPNTIARSVSEKLILKLQVLWPQQTELHNYFCFYLGNVNSYTFVLTSKNVLY